MSIDSMLNDFKDLSEVKAFAEAQTRTILELNKKLRLKEEEVLNLKKILEKSTPLVELVEGEFSSELLLGTDEETISKIQLSKLKEYSFVRDLTMEEARKVEIYTKVLNVSKDKPSKIFEMQKQLPSDDLLKLVTDESNS